MIPSRALGSEGSGNEHRDDMPPRGFLLSSSFNLPGTLRHPQREHPMWNTNSAGKVAGRQGPGKERLEGASLNCSSNPPRARRAVGVRRIRWQGDRGSSGLSGSLGSLPASGRGRM